MNKIVPVLPIDDGEAAKAFYADKLGFDVDFEHRHEPGFPNYIGVKHGELYLHLSEHAAGHPGSELYIFVDDIAAWIATFEANGVVLESGPTKQPWGNTDVVIKDPFGSTLRFSQIGRSERR